MPMAIILPSVGAENAPLVIVEAAMLGLPVMTPDIGSLSMFADEVGNKIKYSNEKGNFGVALQEVIAHLATPDREYDVSHYSLPFYSKSLLQIMQIGEKDTA